MTIVPSGNCPQLATLEITCAPNDPIDLFAPKLSQRISVVAGITGCSKTARARRDSAVL